MKTKDILKKIEILENDYDIWKFVKGLNLIPKQMELLANHENEDVRCGLANNSNLTEKVMIKLSSDKNKHVRRGLAENLKITSEKVMVKLSSDKDEIVRWWLAKNPKITEKLMIKLVSDEDEDVKDEAFKRLQSLNSLKKEELESAYDLINNSKHIGRKNFEETFDFIINKFPELSDLAKMFKRIILKGKKDLK